MTLVGAVSSVRPTPNARGIATPKLLAQDGPMPGARQPGLLGTGEEYAYEILNFVDGRRSEQAIRDAVSAEYGPLPLPLVAEYLRALERIGVVEQIR